METKANVILGVFQMKFSILTLSLGVNNTYPSDNFIIAVRLTEI